MIFAKCHQYTLQIPCGSKFCRNRSISHRFQDECTFFAKTSPVDSADILWDKNFVEIALSRTVSEMAEIQDGCQKWRESDFVKSHQYTLDTLGVENFDEIALSHTVKEIEANLCFSIFGKNSKWPPFLKRVKFFDNCKE